MTTTTTTTRETFGAVVHLRSRRLSKVETHLREQLATDWLPTVRDARADWREFRRSHGATGCPTLLTAPDGNYKLNKSQLPTYGHSCLPSVLAGIGNLCTASTRGCRAACLATAGRGGSPHVVKGRTLRTQFLSEQTRSWYVLISHDLEKATSRHGRIAFRPNVLSDARWELIAPNLFTDHPTIQFYDYTKHKNRTDLPANYHLSFSVSEKTTDEQIHDTINSGTNPVIVFDTAKGHDLPTTYLGHRVIDGDQTDQ